LVVELVNTARGNSGNASGVINALVILENVNLSVLVPHADVVRQFADAVKSAGPQTSAHAAQVVARLDSAISPH
jgi:hypothetical protein